MILLKNFILREISLESARAPLKSCCHDAAYQSVEAS